DPAKESYPALLQTRLGNGYEVHNYGVSGCTMLRKGNLPYWNTPAYQAALAYNPDIVTIDLGGNDSKGINRIYLDEYKKDCHDMIQSFAVLPSHPRIILLLPVVSFVTDSTGIWDPVIVNKIIPLLKEVAYEDQRELFNAHALLIDKPALMPDKIHPEAEGTAIIAKSLYEMISAKRDTGYHVFDKMLIAKTYSSFHGYQCADFVFNGRNCKLVQPKMAAKDHPWVWRARFWGHEPQTDIALLERGYHIVYCDVAELLGNKESIALWDKFYKLVHEAGLSKKAVMEGMSRGAVYVFNWAAANPGKVACVYVDNPLLNIPVWAAQMLQLPAGKNDMFEAFKKDYDLVTPEQVQQFKGGPIELVSQIVKGHYPILILCADEDEAVPPADNTNLFEKKIKALQGDIRVIHKPGFKHHPHSLPDPTPIVDFIIKAVGG
ncbi:MAG TPA: GDSL-type esterase/lipase family protein, partial [Chitinophagaceae bacterium]|nr:GDSL-type esterase/lipase family protein [Chitinophagaceae bacterium]